MDAVYLCGLLEYIDTKCDNDTVLKKRTENVPKRNTSVWIELRAGGLKTRMGRDEERENNPHYNRGVARNLTFTGISYYAWLYLLEVETYGQTTHEGRGYGRGVGAIWRFV